MKSHQFFKILAILILSSKLFAADSLQVSGKVFDLANNPIENAIVSATYGTSDYTDEFGEYGIKIANTAVPIDNPDFQIETEKNIELTLYNLLGQKISNQKYYKYQPIQNLATGIYFAVLHTDKKIISKSKITCVDGKILNLPTTKQLQATSLQKTSGYTIDISVKPNNSNRYFTPADITNLNVESNDLEVGVADDINVNLRPLIQNYRFVTNDPNFVSSVSEIPVDNDNGHYFNSDSIIVDFTRGIKDSVKKEIAVFDDEYESDNKLSDSAFVKIVYNPIVNQYTLTFNLNDLTDEVLNGEVITNGSSKTTQDGTASFVYNVNDGLDSLIVYSIKGDNFNVVNGEVNLNSDETINEKIDRYLEVGDIEDAEFSEVYEKDLSEVVDNDNIEETEYELISDDEDVSLNGKNLEINPNNKYEDKDYEIMVKASEPNGHADTLNFMAKFIPVKTRLQFNLRESATNSLDNGQRGYAIITRNFNGEVLRDSIYIADGQIDTNLVLPSDSDLIVEAGLINKSGINYSFIRTRSLSNSEIKTGVVDIDIVDFYLRDKKDENGNRAIVDSLYVEGYSPQSDSDKMSPQRWYDFIQRTHFNGFLNNVGLIPNKLTRYNTENGLPNEVNIYRYYIDSKGRLSLMEDQIIDKLMQDYTNWIKPFVGDEEVQYNVIEDTLKYSSSLNNNINNEIIIVPDGHSGTGGTAGVLGNNGDIITVKSGIIKLKSGGPYYEPDEPNATRIRLQEKITCYWLFRDPDTLADHDESIVDNRSILNKLSPYDIKAIDGVIMNVDKYQIGEDINRIIKRN